MTISAHRTRQASRMVLGLAAVVASVAATPATASAAFRAGDVGFSIPTQAGQTWVYGDSWNAGIFIRNAMTLDGDFKGSVRNPARSTWFWPGAPFKVAGGRIAMYGAEVTQKTAGMWGMDVLGGIRAEFDPARPTAAKLTRMSPGIIWAAASSEDSQGPIVYGVDANHQARAGRPQADGTVKQISTMGGTISGQFSVAQEVNGKWWLVGQLPFLSRRVVAYPLSSQTGKVTGPAIKLITLPEPGPNRFTYGATLHPEYAGLMTYAVNGNGPGTPYGLQRIEGFWPFALYWARAAADQAAAAAKAKSARHSTLARKATAAGSEGGQGNNGKAKGKGKKLADMSITESRVILWATEKQRDLEKELERRQRLSTGNNWLGPLPDQLGPNMAPAAASAPATWDQAGTDATPPIGEDADSQQQDFLVPATPAGYRRQQAEAKAAIEAAKAALEDIASQLKAAEDQQRADERAAREADRAARAAARLAEAQKRAQDAQGTDEEAAAEQARQQADEAKQQADQAKEEARVAKEAAKQQAEQAKQLADQAKAAAKAKEKAANGQGRKSWD